MSGRADYEALTVPDLRKEAGSRQLDTTGNKPELVDRLVEDDRAKAEAETVPELKDELRDVELPVSGTKPELVDRLVGDEPEPEGFREQRAIEAGGHTIMVDVEPDAPEPITMCSICGREGGCVHTDPEHGQAWTVSEPAAPIETKPDDTFYPDETVGPRSTEGE